MARPRLTTADREFIAQAMDQLFNQSAELGKLWPGQDREFEKAIKLLTGMSSEEYREELGRRQSNSWTRAEFDRRARKIG